MDDISSPIAAHLLDFCDDGGGDLFAAVNATSDMLTASSEDASSSSVTTPPGPSSHGDNASATALDATNSAFSPLPSFDSTLSALLEEEDPPVNDGDLLLPAIEYQYAAAAGVEPQTEQFGQMGGVASAEHAAALQTQMSSTASELMQFASSGYAEDCFAAVAMGGPGGFVGLDEAALCQPPLIPAGVGEAAVQGGCFFGKETAAQGGFFGTGGCGGMVMSMMGMDEIGEFQRMMESAGAGAMVATRSPDGETPMPFGGNPGEMQMSGSMSPGRMPAAASTTTETSSLEDPNFKSARISVEERREKIHRYIKKRNERNFSKKIKYACRKTLADSRPRVRGRFAKNDDYGESSAGMQNHEEYEQMASMKAEDMLDPDVLQAHLSGMNSYMYSHHAVESWL
ncbi:hypothetical protein QOZ80_2AG0127290 [Eleusine coracana subsp. coracana]|nr:hypothetical protein QOZ80_2AG0127290 [Eleusine coracana subsp. coracana]